MQLEKTWPAVSPQPFTADGTNLGVVTIADAQGFYIRQLVQLKSNTQPTLGLQIMTFLGDNQFIVGLQGTGTPSRIVPYDISAYLVSDSAVISAPAQSRGVVGIKPDDVSRAVYQEDPVVALRTLEVDARGNPTNGAKRNSTIPVAYDSFQVLTVDGSDNPLTIGYYVGGLTGTQVWLSTFTYDGSGNIASYVGTP